MAALGCARARRARTICSLMVLPSSSIVRIFCSGAGRGREMAISEGCTDAQCWCCCGVAAVGARWVGAAAHEVDADRADVAVRPLVILWPPQHTASRSASGCNRQQLSSLSAASSLQHVVFLPSEAGRAHREAQEQAGLADTRVADQHQDEEVIICGQGCTGLCAQLLGGGGAAVASASQRGASAAVCTYRPSRARRKAQEQLTVRLHRAAPDSKSCAVRWVRKTGWLPKVAFDEMI